ncbi:MAG TPA: glycosyltransferase family 39 protein, partial [Burkholderiaceae bacterium]|nr:glycosyltransferase family 39 protein [Burkholderiaceae bacterium]
MIAVVQRAFADAPAARRSFVAVLVALTAMRAWFAAALPFTSDEAYFLSWGRNPDWGFYDHPPMVGWWLAALDAISGHRFVLRLPALVAPPLVAAIAWRVLRRHGEALAWCGATLLLLLPLNAWNVAITTDVPLMIFSALTVALYLRACETGRASDFLLAGLALAGALMSKYFAGLLAIAIFL